MATFEETQGMRVQEHFELVEIDLPVITGACTIGGLPGFGTPLTCDQAWTGEYQTYTFTNENVPVPLPGSPWRLISKITETPAELQPGNGLSSRATLTVKLTDNSNQDPNPNAPGVTDLIKKQGTFFGKLDERQVIDNKPVRLKLYRVQPDGSVDLVNGAQTRYYLAESFIADEKGNWTLKCKDVLSLANLGEKSWPIATKSFLRLDIDELVVAIPVDGDTDYNGVFAVRVGDEFMKVISVTDNLLPTAMLNIEPRGTSIIAPVSTEVLTVTEADDHRAGDEVFICQVSDDETIDSFLTRVLVDSDFDPALIPAAEWAAEVAEWHANDKINTLHSESQDVNGLLSKVLTGFLMDLWFSTTENLAKLSAISVWKQSTAALIEGRQINAYTVKKTPSDSLRASRALVAFDKRNLADDDSTSSYKKASQFEDNTIIGPELYGKHKDMQFENNELIGIEAAALLTQRYVSRFKFTPYVREFITDEKWLTFKTGDVVDMYTTLDQAADGSVSRNVRGQIVKITPQYKNEGRSYKVKAMTYEAAFNSGSEIVLDSPLGESNLHTLAGAPSQPVELTFVLTSYSFGTYGFRAGSFALGSKLTIILFDGFDGQANGGSGGRGERIEFDFESGMWLFTPPGNGSGAGVVYDAQGVDTDIYFSGATPSSAYPIADGYIRAPSGGAGGKNHTEPSPEFRSGDGGDGGDGRNPGAGGPPGLVEGSIGSSGDAGISGTINGSSTGWGFAGDDNAASGGSAGKGISDSGATVTLFGDTPTRYINGNGDHP